MLTLPPSVKIFLSTQHCDMRKGHDGLYALVKHQLKADAFSGHLFAFVSRKGNRIKILCWSHGGFILWYKRIERGKFKIPVLPKDQKAVELDSGQLSMLLEGIDYSRVRRPLHWQPPKSR